MVGIPEQRQRILGDGFFVELWVFARDARVQEAMRPGYELPIATEDVYITVEKDAFPALILEPTNPTNEYYRNEVKRGRIMAIVYEWCETYRRYHDDMSDLLRRRERAHLPHRTDRGLPSCGRIEPVQALRLRAWRAVQLGSDDRRGAGPMKASCAQVPPVS